MGLAAALTTLVPLAPSGPSVVRSAAAAPDLLRYSRPLASVFFLAKSENRNQVHYAIRVDDRCRPKGHAPVYGYWRDYEEGPKVTSKLLDHEMPAYGLTKQRLAEPAGEGGKVRFALRGFPDRHITVQTFKAVRGCRAWAMTRITGAQAILQSLYVEIGFLFSIDYVLLKGVRITDGKALKEKVED